MEILSLRGHLPISLEFTASNRVFVFYFQSRLVSLVPVEDARKIEILQTIAPSTEIFLNLFDTSNNDFSFDDGRRRIQRFATKFFFPQKEMIITGRSSIPKLSPLLLHVINSIDIDFQFVVNA